MTSVGIELLVEDADFARILLATSPLEQKHIDEYIGVFQYFDTNQDNFLSTDQAVLAFRAAAVVYQPIALRSMNKVSKHEWLKMCANYAKDEQHSLYPEDQYITMFKAIDVKRRGVIDIEQLHRFFKTTGLGVTVEQTKVLGEAINKYGLGDQVQEEEFVAFMMKRAEINKKAKRSTYTSKEEEKYHSDSTVDVAEAFGFF
jgi:Ca2+-binding EF-hand superfamily protein